MPLQSRYTGYRAPGNGNIAWLGTKESCSTCLLRDGRLCCRRQVVGGDGRTIVDVSHYPKGTTLFLEGQAAGGVFTLCSGRVKLSTSWATGRSLIVRIARPGETVGLTALLSGGAYEVTAETLEPVQAGFIARDRFLWLMEEGVEQSARIARQLTMELRQAYRQLSRLALAPSARAKLAAVLLEWSGSDEGAAFELPLTHEEIGALVGSSRETVTRLLSEFKRKKLIGTRGRFITLRDPAILHTYIDHVCEA